MTDVQAVPLIEGQPGAPAAPDAGTKPVVATISLLGVLLTGLCLAAVDRLDRSAPARSLAVIAVATALVAVLVALGGQLSALLAGQALTTSARTAGRRGVLVVLLAGLLSMLAVLLAGAAALLAVQPHETTTATEPMMIVQRSNVAPESATVTAQLTFPGLKAGAVLDATMATVNEDLTRYVLARSAVRIDADGPATVQLAATANANDDIMIEANAPGYRCTASLPAAGLNDGPAVPINCTTS